MKLKELDVVALKGVVVEVFDQDVYELEIVGKEGKTLALITVKGCDLSLSKE